MNTALINSTILTSILSPYSNSVKNILIKKTQKGGEYYEKNTN